jgi:hypothetical protein
MSVLPGATVTEDGTEIVTDQGAHHSFLTDKPRENHHRLFQVDLAAQFAVFVNECDLGFGGRAGKPASD